MICFVSLKMKLTVIAVEVVGAALGTGIGVVRATNIILVGIIIGVGVTPIAIAVVGLGRRGLSAADGGMSILIVGNVCRGVGRIGFVGRLGRGGALVIRLGGVGAIVVYGRIAVGWGRCGAPAHIATDEREERQAQYQNAYYNGKKYLLAILPHYILP